MLLGNSKTNENSAFKRLFQVNWNCEPYIEVFYIPGASAQGRKKYRAVKHRRVFRPIGRGLGDQSHPQVRLLGRALLLLVLNFFTLDATHEHYVHPCSSFTIDSSLARIHPTTYLRFVEYFFRTKQLCQVRARLHQ